MWVLVRSHSITFIGSISIPIINTTVWTHKYNIWNMKHETDAIGLPKRMTWHSTQYKTCGCGLWVGGSRKQVACVGNVLSRLLEPIQFCTYHRRDTPRKAISYRSIVTRRLLSMIRRYWLFYLVHENNRHRWQRENRYDPLTPRKANDMQKLSHSHSCTYMFLISGERVWREGNMYQSTERDLSQEVFFAYHCLLCKDCIV